MGGFGSGRHWHYNAKATTERARPLDIREVKRSYEMTTGQRIKWQWAISRKQSTITIWVAGKFVILFYRITNDGESRAVEQRVDLEQTECNYGGTRCWWLCPSCDRRVAILYSPEQHFACRQCCKLVYESQRESADYRAGRRANASRKKLCWAPSIGFDAGGRPTGMRRTTFERLTREHDALVQKYQAGMTKWLSSFPKMKVSLKRGLVS